MARSSGPIRAILKTTALQLSEHPVGTVIFTQSYVQSDDQKLAHIHTYIHKYISHIYT